MTRINNTEHILLLIGQQLQRLSDTKRSKKTAKGAHLQKASRTAAERLRSIARSGDVSDDDFNRSFIQGLLTDEFGEALINDPRFQKMTETILQIITSDRASKELLERARAELMD